MNTIAIIKSAQSVFNKYNRETAAQNAEQLAAHIESNFAQYVSKFGTDDIFDLAELAAIEAVKVIKGIDSSL